jgi:hypothetical protein
MTTMATTSSAATRPAPYAPTEQQPSAHQAHGEGVDPRPPVQTHGDRNGDGEDPRPVRTGAAPANATPVSLQPLPVLLISKPHCFCIKMSRGPFADYTPTCLLHCGVSDARGRVYSFDEHGYHLGQWREAISVPLGGREMRDMDEAVATHDSAHKNRGQPYHSGTNNCFDYAVSFLNSVRFRRHADHTRQTTERDLLAEPFVLALQHLRAVAPALQQLQAASYGALCEHIRAGQALHDYMPPPPAKKPRPELELEPPAPYIPTEHPVTGTMHQAGSIHVCTANDDTEEARILMPPPPAKKRRPELELELELELTTRMRGDEDLDEPIVWKRRWLEAVETDGLDDLDRARLYVIFDALFSIHVENGHPPGDKMYKILRSVAAIYGFDVVRHDPFSEESCRLFCGLCPRCHADAAGSDEDEGDEDPDDVLRSAAGPPPDAAEDRAADLTAHAAGL